MNMIKIGKVSNLNRKFSELFPIDVILLENNRIMKENASFDCNLYPIMPSHFPYK